MKPIDVIIRIVVLLSVFVLPWWMSLLIGVIALFKYGFFIEFVFMGLFIDIMFASYAVFENFQYIFTLGTLVVLLLVHRLKERLI